MKALVTGGSGILGSALLTKLREKSWVTVAPDRKTMDITDREQIETVFRKEKPDVVFHCAAYTDVEAAEQDRERCWKINVEGTEQIARYSQELGAKLLYISTEYVFSGRGEKAYKTTDAPKPLNRYGFSKLEGERAVQRWSNRFFIVRTSWLFGEGGRGFPEKLLSKAKVQDEIRVVQDQTGSPTYAPDLAGLLITMAESGKYGIYHASNEGVCSWYEFAKEILKRKRWNGDIIPIVSEELGQKAQRPGNSRLDKTSLDLAGFERLPDWQDALGRCFEK